MIYWHQDTMRHGTIPALAAALLTLVAIGAGAGRARAQGPGDSLSAGQLLRVEARFADPASGLEAGWGATGQVLIPPIPADPALHHWQQVRSVATSQARQSVVLAPGGRGLIRVGRQIPFAGWFLQRGIRCGWIEPGTAWGDVEAALEVEFDVSEDDGTVSLALTPEFSYPSGRSRACVPFAGDRAEIVLTPGAEVRFAPDAELAAFYGRLLAGYDPLRRVWPVELILRVDFVDSPEL